LICPVICSKTEYPYHVLPAFTGIDGVPAYITVNSGGRNVSFFLNCYFGSDNMKHIEVISLDRIGLVGEISNVIRRLNGNIITHTADVLTDNNGIPVSHFRAEVDFGCGHDTDAAVKRLKRLKNVRQVKITDI